MSQEKQNPITLDFCPFCHVDGDDYKGGILPIGVFRTKESLAKYERFWVECQWCKLRTQGRRSAEEAAIDWNTRRCKSIIAEQRESIIAAANYALLMLNHKPSDCDPD